MADQPAPETSRRHTKTRRVRTPTILQMEAVECGAAALGIILAHHGRWIPLEELRIECGVSRDGSKASHMVKAARRFGLKAAGYTCEPDELRTMPLPMIVFWNFNHFVVVEGFGKGKVHLNDPAQGPRVVSDQEFDESFTGVVLVFEKTPAFERGGHKPDLFHALVRRLRGSEGALLYAVLAGLGLVVPGLVIPTFTRIFVDDVLIGGLNGWLKPLLVGMAVAAVLRSVLTWLQGACLLRLETKVSVSSSSRFLSHVLRLPLVFFYQRFAGEIGSRVRLNDTVAQLVAGEFAATIISIITVVFYAAVMLAYDVVLTLLAIAFAVANLVALRYVSRKRVDENQKLLRARGQLIGASMGGLQMIEDLKATGAESDFFANWAGRYANMINAEQRLGVYNAFLLAVPLLLDGFGVAALLAIGGYRVIEGHMSLGMLVAFQSLAASFAAPMSQLVGLGSSLQEVRGDMARLDDVLRYETDPHAVDTLGETAPAATVRLAGHLELRDVTFGYSRFEPPLIEGLNLVLRPGERVALVGGSGSGKSTIARLVAGFFEPWEGAILFDGQPRHDVPRRVLNDSLAFVDQEIFLFAGTIRDNLTLWDTTAAEEKLLQAARDACIHDDVAVRRDGYDGETEEAGANFSGGQRQRLEIARALVNEPTILVLDEATSALDAGTEKRIDDHLRRRGCTCLIVAHRLSTIRDCDEIVVLERGKVVQRGTHESLKDVEGPYARLVEL